MNKIPAAALSRDIRVTRAWRTALGSKRQGSRISGFAAAVLARYARNVATLFGPERVMRRHAARAASVRHFHRDGGVTVQPRFDIRLIPVVRTRAIPATLAPWRVTTPSSDAPAPPPRHAALQRIMARERRLDSTTPMQSVLHDIVALPLLGGETSHVPVRVKKLEMAVRRPPAPVAEAPPPRSKVADPAGAGDWNSAPSTSRPVTIAASFPLSATEIGRVTDHVVRAIDRRVVAIRERHGRI